MYYFGKLQKYFCLFPFLFSASLFLFVVQFLHHHNYNFVSVYPSSLWSFLPHFLSSLLQLISYRIFASPPHPIIMSIVVPIWRDLFVRASKMSVRGQTLAILRLIRKLSSLFDYNYQHIEGKTFNLAYSFICIPLRYTHARKTKSIFFLFTFILRSSTLQHSHLSCLFGSLA